jgi:hypothetical protein
MLRRQQVEADALSSLHTMALPFPRIRKDRIKIKYAHEGELLA